MRILVLAAIFVTAIVRGAELPAALLAEEDRIDSLDLTDQAPAYREFQAKLPGSADDHPRRERIDRKLAFASARSSESTPVKEKRLEFCRLATEIGRLHLKQRDPERAMRWQRIAENVQPINLWAGALRSSIHTWYRTKLNSALDAEDWASARATLRQWQVSMGQAHPIESGIDGYAETRADSLRSLLHSTGSTAAMRELQLELNAYPDRSAWRQLTKDIVHAAQKQFNLALNLRQADSAKAKLDELEVFASQFGVLEYVAIEDKHHELEQLIQDLLPIPLQRELGFVRAPAFRFEFAYTLGDGKISQAGETLEDSVFLPTIALDWRRGREESRWWWGAGLSLVELDVTNAGAFDGVSTIHHFNALMGYRGSKWSAWGGTGFAQSPVEFNGPTITNLSNIQSFGTLRLGGEYALTERVTLGGDARISLFGGLKSRIVSLNSRYYINSNIAVGVKILSIDGRWEDTTKGLDVEGESLSLGGAMTIQF